MTSTYTEQLTDFVCDCALHGIPKEIREQTAFLLLDALGVAMYNSNKPFVAMMRNVLEKTVQSGPCTAIGSRVAFVAEGAAMLNSSAIHGNDFDATHVPAIMHTSAVVIPTALAVAEEAGTSGGEVVAAIIAGSEVLIRMGLATQGAMHRVGFQSTALCAPIVLAMVAGRLYGLPREQIVNAAGLSASIAAGLRAFSDDGTWGKRVITGWACRAALTAIALAREGYPGTRDVLEKAPYGFYKAFLQNGGYRLEELANGLGSKWTTGDIEVKLYPCSHGHHGFVSSARRAKRELNLSPGQIKAVRVLVSSEARRWWFEPHDRKYELTDVYGSRFSLPFTIALALVFGELRDEYLDSRQYLDDPRVRAVVAKVTPRIDDTLSNTNPNRMPGTIEITTTDGRNVKFDGEGHVGDREALQLAIRDKFMLNVSEWPGDVSEITALATDFEAQPSVRPLMRLLRV